MKFKKTSSIIIISAVVVAAAAIAAALIWILPAAKPVYEGVKPVSQDTGQVSLVTGKETKSTFEALNINPGDINRIILIKESDGSFSTDDKGKISEIIGIVNTTLTASKEKPGESKDDVKVFFYKQNALLGSMRISTGGCTIGTDIYMIPKTSFDLEKLHNFIPPPKDSRKEFFELVAVKGDIYGQNDTSSLMGSIKDYVDKMEVYFKNKAFWEMTDIDAEMLGITYKRLSPYMLVVSYVPNTGAFGGEKPKWALVFDDDGSGSIKCYRALEGEDILITDSKFFGGRYLILAGRCGDASTAVIGYEIKNGALIKTKIVEDYLGDGFEVYSDNLLKNNNLSPVSFISPKGSTPVNGSGFRGFTDDGFNIMMSKAITFSFDGSKNLFTVKSIMEAVDWSKQEAEKLYKSKFFKDMPETEFPADVTYEEVLSKAAENIYGQSIRLSICSITPKGFVSEKSGEYEIGGYVLNVDSWSTPSASGLYAIINDNDIMTLDDALYSGKYTIDMKELYPKLPQRYRDLKYVTLSSSQEEELEQIARKLVENNVEAYTKIFVVDSLPPDVEGPISINENAIYPVRSDKFKTMADLDGFVRGTYIKRTAERLLNNPNGWGPMYVEKDGRLCIDESKVGGVGYYRDWRDCKITLSEITENSSTLTVTVKEDGFDIEPDHPVDVVFKMIKQGERWLLTDMKH